MRFSFVAQFQLLLSENIELVIAIVLYLAFISFKIIKAQKVCRSSVSELLTGEGKKMEKGRDFFPPRLLATKKYAHPLCQC